MIGIQVNILIRIKYLRRARQKKNEEKIQLKVEVL